MAIPPPPAESSMLSGAIPPPPENPQGLKDSVSSDGPELASVLGQSNGIMARGIGYVLDGIKGVDETRALATNEPTQGIAENVIRGIPATVGAMAGAASFAAGGPTAIAGAGLGAAAGEGVRQNVAQIYSGLTGTQFTPPGTVFKDIAVQGVAGVAGEAIGQGITAAAPFAKKVAAGYLRVGPNIPTNVGEAVLNDPGILKRALTPAQMSDQYSVFQTVNGLASPSQARGEAGNLIFKPGEAEDVVNSVYQKIIGKDAVPATTQELYEGSQAARFLRDQAKMSNPQQAANLGNITKAKAAIDTALEDATATSGRSYSALRQANFESKAAEMFKSPYPVNVNGQPNVLRSVAAARTGAEFGAGVGALAGGVPGAIAGGAVGGLVGPAAVSPVVYGATIKTAAAVSPIAKAAAKGFIFAPGSVAAFYNSPGVVTP